MSPLWLYRPLLNWQEVVDWLALQGVRKIIPPEQLHSTVATVRTPCETYRGEIVLGPEVAREFDEVAGRSVKHVRVDTIATLPAAS